ncbi:MAG: type I restriction enzyme HsdR N-terminal domain-containing protein [Ekhidna sp.]
MKPLKLPEYDVRLKESSPTEIFCLIRKKWLVLTPEEWVRQHFINLLISHLGYPKGLIKLEQSMSYFKNKKRSDIIVMDRSGDVFLLVECKASDVPLDKKVMNQLSEYNKVLDSKYLSISNGLKHFIWVKREDVFEQITEFPIYK